MMRHSRRLRREITESFCDFIIIIFLNPFRNNLLYRNDGETQVMAAYSELCAMHL